MTLTAESVYDTEPAWAPDGRSTVFVRDEDVIDGQGSIRRMDEFYMVQPNALTTGGSRSPSWGLCAPSRNWPPC